MVESISFGVPLAARSRLSLIKLRTFALGTQNALPGCAKQMTGNSENRLSGHAEPGLLHDGRCHSHPLAGAGGTGQLGRAGCDDSPGAVFWCE